MFKLSKIALLTSLVSFSGISYADSIVNEGSTDLGVLNKDRILYWLEKRGELSASASDEERQKAFDDYLAKRMSNQNNKPHKGLMNQQALVNEAVKVSIAEKQFTKSTSVQRAGEDVDNTIKVLALMIDFPDLPYNDNGLDERDTDMYYSDYPMSHYQDLLFSPTGFTGPSGQILQSAYQYYQQESGNSFAFNGDTFGWFTADNNAQYYGANNDDPRNDFNQDDVNVGELVIEAVEKAIAENQIDLSDYDKISEVDHDGDGNLDEPDGIVDHIMIFHSSVGEESGGGVLGSNAIWSHRSAVFTADFDAAPVEGSTIRIFSYTITPIDASMGVVVHEFGHVLGVPDEYDLTNDFTGAPVQAWSVMASGSWLGSPRGSEPVSFSPYAKEFFQNRYGGNWVNQQTVTFSDSTNETLSLVSASTHGDSVDQIRVDLPKTPRDFGQPFTGEYQYYSNQGNDLNNSLSFNTTLGSNSPTLTMKARWSIEQDYDYAVVEVNGTAISGSHTKARNSFHSDVNNFISGDSASFSDATGDLDWVDLTFDLSSYSGQNIDIEIIYVSDESIINYGLVIDDITITSGNSTTFSNGAETLSSVSLNGFNRIDETVEGDNHYYYVQLRDHNGTDSSLPTLDYDPGVLIWYRNEAIDNNNVSSHPGELFLGVVDADQNLILRNGNPRNTEIQIRDAAFSLYDQTASTSVNDTSLTNNSVFNDSDDYTSPEQVKSGVILPVLGVNMAIITQASNSSTATVLLTNANDTTGGDTGTSDDDNGTSGDDTGTSGGDTGTSGDDTGTSGDDTGGSDTSVPDTTVPTITTDTTSTSDSGSSGGSIHWLALLFAGLFVNRRYANKK